MFELRKCRESMFDGTQDWYKFWRKTDFCFQKWQEEFGKFSIEDVQKSNRGIHLSVQNWHEEFDKFWAKISKISQICTLMGCFCPKYIMFQLQKV